MRVYILYLQRYAVRQLEAGRILAKIEIYLGDSQLLLHPLSQLFSESSKLLRFSSWSVPSENGYVSWLQVGYTADDRDLLQTNLEGNALQ